MRRRRKADLPDIRYILSPVQLTSYTAFQEDITQQMRCKDSLNWPVENTVPLYSDPLVFCYALPYCKRPTNAEFLNFQNVCNGHTLLSLYRSIMYPLQGLNANSFIIVTGSNTPSRNQS